MKKLLIVPMVLALVIFGFYHQEVNGQEDMGQKSNSEKNLIPEDIPIYDEIIEIYNSSNDEINSSLKKTESNSDKKKFTLNVGSDINTTREKMVTLEVQLENTKNIDSCNYFWHEGKTVIGVGSSIKHAFDKGEHNLTVHVSCAEGDEGNASLLLRAYDYYIISREHYNAYYGELEYVEKEIFNHKDRHLLMDDGIFSKYLYQYDEKGHTTQIKNEYYEYPNENETTLYEYDEVGNKVKETILNANGDTIYMSINTYSEDGNLTSSKSGVDEDSLVEETYDNSQYETTVYHDNNESNTDNTNKEIKKYNDNNKLIYEEIDYGIMKIICEYEYDDDTLRQETTHIVSDYRNQFRISTFNEKGEIIAVEKRFTNAESTSCHYKTEYTYTDNGNIKSKVDVLLEGECPYIDEVKRLYSYDEEGNRKGARAILDGDETSSTTILKVIKSYTNELEAY